MHRKVLTLDEAIQHCLEVADKGKSVACSANHTQLAEWLKEYKALKREQIGEYFIVTSFDPTQLSLSVNKWLDEGCELWGHLSVTTSDQYYDGKAVDQVMVFSQGMIKKRGVK